MRRGGRTFILLGLILAVVAFVGITMMMRRSQNEKPPEVVTRQVIVAAADIPARTTITSELLEFKEIPVAMVPPLAVTDVYSVTGRITLNAIYADQVILSSMISSADMDESLLPALSIPDGMVAIALPINEISGVAQAMRDGDHVDVIVALRVKEFDPQGNESQPEYSAQFTIQNVEVLHIGAWGPLQPTETKEEGASGGILGSGGSRSGGSVNEQLSVVILLVEPQDALVLKYAMDKKEEEGREAFTLVLRPVESTEQYTTEPVNQDYMVKRFNFSKPPFIIIEK